MSNALTTEQWVGECNVVHGGKYDYSKVIYKTAKEKVCIICSEHGEFWQESFSHKTGVGCPYCGRRKSDLKRRLSTEEFVRRAVEVHGDKYSYSETIYKNQKTHITFKCGVHGLVKIKPYDHLAGNGCKACGVERRTEERRMKRADFIKRSIEVHGQEYDYSLVEMKDSRSKVAIKCRIHGVFYQQAAVHVNGHGCMKCHKDTMSLLLRSNNDEFIEKATVVHGKKYDYSKVKYEKSNEKVIIVCSKCEKEFAQTPGDHLQGYGCPHCIVRTSKAEDELSDYVESLGFSVQRNDRSILNGLEVDIFVPDRSLCIEYNGSWWHSDKFIRNGRNKIHEKSKLAQAMGLRLVHVFDYEDLEVVKRTIRYMLVREHKMHARKCSVISTSSNDPEVVRFMKENHLQGGVKNCIAYCLRSGDELVAVMIMSKVSSERGAISDNRYELRRFSSKYSIRGAASKLLKRFIKDHSRCEEIISYSDNRWFTGDMYKAIGFTNVSDIPPDYKYVKANTVVNKSRFKRSELEKREDIVFDPSKTEVENCRDNGWYRVWDCGKKKWSMLVK